MSSDALFDVGPVDENTLTERQRAVLRVARAPEGVDAREAGVAAHAVSGCRYCAISLGRAVPGTPPRTVIEPCQYAERDGNAILRRLRDLGHVKYRAKLKTWHATTGRSSSQTDAGDPFPDGF